MYVYCKWGMFFVNIMRSKCNTFVHAHRRHSYLFWPRLYRRNCSCLTANETNRHMSDWCSASQLQPGKIVSMDNDYTWDHSWRYFPTQNDVTRMPLLERWEANSLGTTKERQWFCVHTARQKRTLECTTTRREFRLICFLYWCYKQIETRSIRSK